VSGGTRRRPDAIVVGAGHNGLVAACYLARAGLDVLVLERNAYIGGAAVSRRLYDGFIYSNCSYVCSLLRTEIIRALELPRFGLQIIPYEGGCTLMRGGGHLALYDNHDALRREIARHSRRDAEGYDRFVRTCCGTAASSSRCCCARHPIRPPSGRAISVSSSGSAGTSTVW
jgi:phytoene dehydrogenase-like protein